jgi:hypothetical protein
LKTAGTSGRLFVTCSMLFVIEVNHSNMKVYKEKLHLSKEHTRSAQERTSLLKTKYGTTFMFLIKEREGVILHVR